MIKNENIRDVKWYSGTFPGVIGIVLYDTGFGFKAYIGPGGGQDESVDKFYICERGCRFHEASRLWPEITKWAQ